MPSSTRPIPEFPDDAKKLLSMDGGGVKGISSVMILDNILASARAIKRGVDDPGSCHAHEYFDLAGGTSTGGLAVLMMFRLRMSTADTMDGYRKMSQQIFSPRVVFGLFDIQEKLGKFGYLLGNPLLKLRALNYPSRFSPEPLEEAVLDVIRRARRAQVTKLMDSPGSPKMEKEFSSAPTYHQTDAVPITESADFSDVTILQAARATSAAPTYFPPIGIKPKAARPGIDPPEHTFWDGGMLNNNPIDQVWDARYDLADNLNQTPVVSCIVSIGTGNADYKPDSSWWFVRTFKTVFRVLDFVMNTEAKHKDFKHKIARMNERLPDNHKTEYFRFNVPTGNEDFPLDDWQMMTRLESLTTTYLARREVEEEIDRCARILAR